MSFDVNELNQAVTVVGVIGQSQKDVHDVSCQLSQSLLRPSDLSSASADLTRAVFALQQADPEASRCLVFAFHVATRTVYIQLALGGGGPAGILSAVQQASEGDSCDGGVGRKAAQRLGSDVWRSVEDREAASHRAALALFVVCHVVVAVQQHRGGGAINTQLLQLLRTLQACKQACGSSLASASSATPAAGHDGAGGKAGGGRGKSGSGSQRELTGLPCQCCPFLAVAVLADDGAALAEPPPPSATERQRGEGRDAGSKAAPGPPLASALEQQLRVLFKRCRVLPPEGSSLAANALFSLDASARSVFVLPRAAMQRDIAAVGALQAWAESGLPIHAGSSGPGCCLSLLSNTAGAAAVEGGAGEAARSLQLQLPELQPLQARLPELVALRQAVWQRLGALRSSHQQLEQRQEGATVSVLTTAPVLAASLTNLFQGMAEAFASALASDPPAAAAPILPQQQQQQQPIRKCASSSSVTSSGSGGGRRRRTGASSSGTLRFAGEGDGDAGAAATATAAEALLPAMQWLVACSGGLTRFSAARCRRAAAVAAEAYKQAVPELYLRSVHDSALGCALSTFHAAARGPGTAAAEQALVAECERVWRDREQCSAVSLFGRPCTLPVHDPPPLLPTQGVIPAAATAAATAAAADAPTKAAATTPLGVVSRGSTRGGGGSRGGGGGGRGGKRHDSGVKLLVASCDGTRRMHVAEPFDLREANEEDAAATCEGGGSGAARDTGGGSSGGACRRRLLTVSRPGAAAAAAKATGMAAATSSVARTGGSVADASGAGGNGVGAGGGVPLGAWFQVHDLGPADEAYDEAAGLALEGILVDKAGTAGGRLCALVIEASESPQEASAGAPPAAAAAAGGRAPGPGQSASALGSEEAFPPLARATARSHGVKASPAKAAATTAEAVRPARGARKKQASRAGIVAAGGSSGGGDGIDDGGGMDGGVDGSDGGSEAQAVLRKAWPNAASGGSPFPSADASVMHRTQQPSGTGQRLGGSTGGGARSRGARGMAAKARATLPPAVRVLVGFEYECHSSGKRLMLGPSHLFGGGSSDGGSGAASTAAVVAGGAGAEEGGAAAARLLLQSDLPVYLDPGSGGRYQLRRMYVVTPPAPLQLATQPRIRIQWQAPQQNPDALPDTTTSPSLSSMLPPGAAVSAGLRAHDPTPTTAAAGLRAHDSTPTTTTHDPNPTAWHEAEVCPAEAAQLPAGRLVVVTLPWVYGLPAQWLGPGGTATAAARLDGHLAPQPGGTATNAACLDGHLAPAITGVAPSDESHAAGGGATPSGGMHVVSDLLGSSSAAAGEKHAQQQQQAIVPLQPPSVRWPYSIVLAGGTALFPV